MGNIIFDISYEKRLIDLLGYNIVGPDNSNRWIILDSDKQVGFIQYKKIKKSSKENPAIYAYCTEIDSSTIIYNKIRNSESTKFCDEVFYELCVKNEADIPINFRFSFGDVPSIHGGSKNSWFHFNIGSGNLHLNFTSKSEVTNFEEFVDYCTNIELRPRFTYVVTSHDKKTNAVLSHLSLSVGTDKRLMKKNQVEVTERYAFDDSLGEYTKCILNGTVEEAALNNEMALEALNYFRNLINELLPFNVNLFDILVTNEVIEVNGLKSFFDAAREIENKSLTKH